MVAVTTSKGIERACPLYNFLDTTSDHLLSMSTFIDTLLVAPSNNFSHSEIIQSAYSLLEEVIFYCLGYSLLSI